MRTKRSLFELEEEAQELIALGNSREKAEGMGMMTVIHEMRTYLMNTKTGSVDTKENWEQEGYTEENSYLIEVVKDMHGDWVEKED